MGLEQEDSSHAPVGHKGVAVSAAKDVNAVVRLGFPGWLLRRLLMVHELLVDILKLQWQRGLQRGMLRVLE